MNEAINIDELERLLGEATPGPWNTAKDGTLIISAVGIVARAFGDPAEPVELSNAALIVAAVNALPELMAEVKRLRAELDKCGEQLELNSGIDPICEVCGEFFVAQRVGDKFCSRQCASEHRDIAALKGSPT